MSAASVRIISIIRWPAPRRRGPARAVSCCGVAQLRAQRRARQHEHVLLEVGVEVQLVGARAVVEREVARLQHRVAPVLRDDAAPSVWMLTRKWSSLARAIGAGVRRTCCAVAVTRESSSVASESTPDLAVDRPPAPGRRSRAARRCRRPRRSSTPAGRARAPSAVDAAGHRASIARRRATAQRAARGRSRAAAPPRQANGAHVPSIGAARSPPPEAAMAIEHPKFRAAAVQAAPVFLDLDAVDRQGDRPDRARPPANGAQLIAFPGDLAARLSVVHLARLAGLGHAVHPALPRQLAGLRHAAGRAHRRRRPSEHGDHGRHGPQREARRQPLHGPVDHRCRRRDGREAPQAQAHARRAHRVRRRRRQRPERVRHRARPARRAVLLGAPAAAVEVRDVRAERAGPHRGVAELLALPRRRLRARRRR